MAIKKSKRSPEFALSRNHSLLFQLNSVFSGYGTEDFSVFLYSLVKMARCRNIVELGTGWGNSAFWIGQALKEIGSGTLWTFENGDHFADLTSARPVVTALNQAFGFSPPRKLKGRELYFWVLKRIQERLELSKECRLIKGDIDLEDFGSAKYRLGAQPIDLVFSDFEHDPAVIMTLLAMFLPRMSDWSHIFIDSASTKLDCYLTLEQTVSQLNQGSPPKTILHLCPARKRADLEEFVHHHRFILVHMVENKDRSQNSTAWIKIEPRDIVGFPIDLMQG